MATVDSTCSGAPPAGSSGGRQEQLLEDIKKTKDKLNNVEHAIEANDFKGTIYDDRADAKVALVQLREHLNLLLKEKNLLLEQQQQQQHQSGEGAAQVTGTKAVGMTDTTAQFFLDLDLLPEPPCFNDLDSVFSTLLTSKGAPAKLPVTDAMYRQLAQSNSTLESVIGSTSDNPAHALAENISVALRRSPVCEPTDEITIAGIIDPLLEPISTWVSERYGTGIKRKRNCVESSLTVDRKRPDLIWLVEGTLLFKGEDKTSDSAMDDALQDLLCKMKYWSSNYHGEVEYLLCYAAAGSIMQFCALKRGDTERVHKLGNSCNLKTHAGVLSCLRYAIITSSIVCLQRKQLSNTFTPLGFTSSRDNGTTIAFFDGYVVKSVDCSATPMSDDQVDALAQLYASTQSNDHVVHALSGPRKTACTKAHANGVYSVELQPLGQEAVRERLDADRLCSALRCILSGLQSMHNAGYGHGDLRWPNVIVTARDHFVLIDLESAVKLGTRFDTTSQSSMPQAWRNGAVLVQGQYTVQSDLQQVADMFAHDTSQRVQGLVQRLRTASTATEILDEM